MQPIPEKQETENGGSRELQIQPEGNRAGVSRCEPQQHEDRPQAAAKENGRSETKRILPVQAPAVSPSPPTHNKRKHSETRTQVQEPGELKLRNRCKQYFAEGSRDPEERSGDHSE